MAGKSQKNTKSEELEKIKKSLDNLESQLVYYQGENNTIMIKRIKSIIARVKKIKDK